MKNSWNQSGNTYFLREISQQADKLVPAIYIVRHNLRMGFYLERVSAVFALPKKMYGVTSNFVNRVKRTWHALDSNMGVLLNGIRGTGKTVTCEVICNELELPALIIDTDYDGLDEFLSNIQQDVVLFFDEFEKVFPRDYSRPSKLLMLMDGVTKGVYRKLFLLTTNELTIERNMIQRPGRIRYIKTFNNLDPATILEIVTDRVNNPAFIGAIVEFIAELELITIDIVSSIVDEVNIHDELPEAFKDVFNIKKISELFAVFEVIRDPVTEKEHEVLRFDNARIYPSGDLEKGHVGYNFTANRQRLGDIDEIIDNRMLVVQPEHSDEVLAKAEETGQKLETLPKKVYRLEPRNSYNQVYGKAGKLALAYQC